MEEVLSNIVGDDYEYKSNVMKWESYFEGRPEAPDWPEPSQGYGAVGEVPVDIRPEDTTITVSTTSGPWPKTPFKIKVDEEIMYVTKAEPLQWQVVRGLEGTEVIKHYEGAKVVPKRLE